MKKPMMACFFQQRLAQSSNKIEVMTLVYLNDMFQWS